MERYENRIAIVTGASMGIGAAIVKELLKSNMKVVAMSRRKGSIVETISKDLPQYKQNLHSLSVDVTIEKQLKDAFSWVSKTLGPISVVVNNAGVLPDCSIINGKLDVWRSVIDTNLMAVGISCREAIKIMRENKISDGYIININSFLGHDLGDAPGIDFYVVSKHGLTALIKQLRYELRRSDSTIRVASLSPGLVDTQMVTDVSIPKGLPMLRAEDVANAVKFILSTPENVYIEELLIRPVGEKF